MNRFRLAAVLLPFFVLGCSKGEPTGPAKTLFEPLDSPDVVGFFWSRSMAEIRKMLGTADSGPDLPLMPDAAVLAMLGTPGVDASQPATLVFVDPQVYDSSVAYVLAMTNEVEFLRAWRMLAGMQEVAGEDLHFFANRRTLRLTSTSLFSVPAEVKRRDYYLFFRDGLALVLPSKDAERAVRHVVDRYNLRSPNTDLAEFLSLDVDHLVRAHADFLKPLQDMLARGGGAMQGGAEDSPFAAIATMSTSIGKWALERVADLDHLWFARSGTTFSAKLALKPGSALRDDLSLFGGQLTAPFSHVPPTATWALDLALEPSRLSALTKWLIAHVPVKDEALKNRAIGGDAKRIQWITSTNAMVFLVECQSEASAHETARALAPQVELDQLAKPQQVDLPFGQLPAIAMNEAKAWFAVRGAWCGLAWAADGKPLEEALDTNAGSALIAQWPQDLLAGACGLMRGERRADDGTRIVYVARLAWVGDELLIDGRDLVSE